MCVAGSTAAGVACGSCAECARIAGEGHCSDSRSLEGLRVNLPGMGSSFAGGWRRCDSRFPGEPIGRVPAAMAPEERTGARVPPLGRCYFAACAALASAPRMRFHAPLRIDRRVDRRAKCRNEPAKRRFQTVTNRFRSGVLRLSDPVQELKAKPAKKWQPEPTSRPRPPALDDGFLVALHPVGRWEQVP